MCLANSQRIYDYAYSAVADWVLGLLRNNLKAYNVVYTSASHK